MPALLIRICTSPTSARTASAAAATASADETSTTWVDTVPPCASSSAAVSFNAPSLMSHRTTWDAFCFTAMVANSLPSPIAAPVTRTILPSTDFMACLLLQSEAAHGPQRRRQRLRPRLLGHAGQRRDREEPLHGNGLDVRVLQHALCAVPAP